MRITKLGAALGMIALAVIAVATPARAHPAPFTVKAGSAPASTTVRVTATTSTGVSFRDTSTGITMSCRAMTVPGSVVTGVRTTGAKTIAFDGRSAVFSGCIGPPSARFSLVGVGTWYLNVAQSSDGVATGTLSNVIVTVKAENVTTCSFTLGANTGSFTGTVAPAALTQTYDNSTRQILLAATNPGRFGLWNVNGGSGRNYCILPSVFKTGDRMSMSARLDLRADVLAYNPIAIT